MKKWKTCLLLCLFALGSFTGSCKNNSGSATKDATGGSTDASAAAKFITAANLSPQYIDMAAKLSQAGDKYQLDKLIHELKQNYDSYPADLQFLAAFYVPMEVLRSVVYRFDGVFRKSVLGGRNGTSHSIYVTLNRLAGNAINSYLPNNNWRAGYAYFTEPLNGNDATNAQFASIREYQGYLANTILPSLTTMRDRIAKINFTFAAGGPAKLPPAGYIVADNKVLYGTIGEGNTAIEPFPNNLDRFVLIGEAERKAVLAAINMAIANTMMLCAVNIDAVLDVQDALAQELVTQQAAADFDSIEGLSTQKRAEILKNFATKFQLFTVENKEMIKNSYDYVKTSVNLSYEAWKEVKARNVEDNTGTRDVLQNFLAINPSRTVPYSRMTDAGYQNIINIVNNDTASVRSDVTGEVVDVKFRQFFENPPANLTEFLAINFDTRSQLTDNGLTYRNYHHGTPLEWSYTTYAKYFPSIKKIDGSADSTDIRSTVRTVGQAWGGLFVSGPLNMAIL